MSEAPQADEVPAVVALLRRINTVCDRFETAWRAKTPPCLENFLAGWEGDERKALLHELIPLDADYRRLRGAAVRLEDYRERFPELIPWEMTLAKLLDAPSDRATDSLWAPNTPKMAPRGSGRYFGTYELMEEIARGGMGIVYKARQRNLNRDVALKMVLSGEYASPDEVRRFRTEAENAARLDHPNIVPIYEVGEQAGLPFFSMKLIEGGSLAGYIRHFACDHRAAVRLVATVAHAIHHAHTRGILHRDLKPGNILIDAMGQPQITDFGLAKQIQGTSNLTRSGVIIGTPAYMAPEQILTPHDLTPAADVFSLGVILYEILTGQVPLQGENAFETLQRIIENEPPTPCELNPDVERDLESICLKCLRKDPTQRYLTAAAFADDLERWLNGEPAIARPLNSRRRLIRWLSQRPALALTWIALFVFYSAHLAFLALGKEDESGHYHAGATTLVGIWATSAIFFQWLSRRSRWAVSAAFAWAAADVFLFTCLLWLGDGPSSGLAVGYFILLGGSVLRSPRGLVWFVMAWSMAAYVGLACEAWWNRPELAIGAYDALIFLLGLLVMGVLLALLMRHTRSARRSYSSRGKE